MCVVFWASNAHPRYVLVVASNRDEYIDRPTQRLHRWAGSAVVAGRDARAGGTWLAAGASIPRWGVLTNITAAKVPLVDGAPSRGSIVPDWLEPSEPAATARAHCERLLSSGARSMAGFNAVLGEITPGGKARACAVSNRGDCHVAELTDAVHGMENQLGADAPSSSKISRGRALLSEALARAGTSEAALIEEIFETVLTDAAYFIPEADYCTRTSTVLLVDVDGHVAIIERARLADDIAGPDGRDVRVEARWDVSAAPREPG